MIRHSRKVFFKTVVVTVVGLFVVGVSLIFSHSPTESRSVVTRAAAASQDSGVLVVGEELTYNVSYAFLDIGQIRIKILGKDTAEGGRTYYKAIAYIDSYSGIPFVNLHVIYESHIDERLYSRLFLSRLRDDSKWFATVYRYDFSGQKVYIEKGWAGSAAIESLDSLTLDTLYQDGLSLYYYARRNLKSARVDTIPTLIREEKARTFIDFMNKRSGAKIDAVDYPVDVIEFEGNAEFVGVFGLTGEFQGWFSNDDAKVPVLAKMKVIIGNVRVELMKWNRPGWIPPRYVQQSGR